MNFTVEKSYYGTWTLNGEKLSWELSDSNKFIPKNATGSFKAKTNNKATITVNTNLAKDNENHKVKIEFEVAHID